MHEYIHKKSAKHRLFRRDLLGIDCGKNLSVLDEAITEKITCEILSLSEEEQMQNGYASVFKAVDKLTELIPWEDIVKAYFTNNPKVFIKALGKKDLQVFLLCLLNMYEHRPSDESLTKLEQRRYINSYSFIVQIIDYHIGK